MSTDMVDFGGQMGVDAAGMLWLLGIHNQMIKQIVTNHLV